MGFAVRHRQRLPPGPKSLQGRACPTVFRNTLERRPFRAATLPRLRSKSLHKGFNLRRTALLMLAAALAVVCCRAQEQPAAPVAGASAPAAAAVQAATQADPDYPVQVHSFRTFVKRLYSVRALTSTLQRPLSNRSTTGPMNGARTASASKSGSPRYTGSS